MAQLSKVFYAAESGTFGQFAGLQLQNIPVEEEINEDELEEHLSVSDDEQVQFESTKRKYVAKKMKCTKKRFERKVWKDEEKDLVRTHFASYIMQGKLPGKESIESFLEKMGWDRKWTNVKDLVRNTYLK